MIPYALALGASSFEAGLLSSARNLLLAGVQLASSRAVAWAGSRKRLVLLTAGLQALLWLPLAFVEPLFGGQAVAALIPLYTLGTGAAALGAPAWGSLVAEYLAANERGRYFGERARFSGVWGMSATFAAGGVLQLVPGRVLGFGILCLGAFVSRVASWLELSRFHEEP